MNVQLRDITVTARDGRVSHLDQVYIRGSHVRFFIVPDMLRYCFATPAGKGGRRRLIQECVGTLQCSDLGRFVDVVWDWREEGLR